MNFVEELRWRGMVHDIMPGTEELLLKEPQTGYVGIDPTGPSLHIGHLVSVMLLVNLQRAGHKPVALIGGATAMVGDPSGKSEERNLLPASVIKEYQEKIKIQLEKFLDFNKGEASAEILNNFDWFKEFNFLDFLRDVGKHLTISYMMAKDSVQKRLETGISFTEFSYQLLQAYDFFWLFKNKNCRLQMGGSDQWGNIVAGTELIRRMSGGEAFALTTPLITKADGAKFGKTEEGNVWLDPKLTSPYKFFQYWINCSDEEAKKYIRIFTLMNRDEISKLEAEHDSAPHLRILQKAIARDLTIRIHSEADYNIACEASEILFGKGTTDTLKRLPEETLLAVLEGVPAVHVQKSAIEAGLNVVDFLSETTKIFPSKGEARKTLQGGGISINKEKTDDIGMTISSQHLLNNKYILTQKGKKNYFLVIAD